MKPTFHTLITKFCTLLVLCGTLILPAYGQLAPITLTPSSYNADLIAESGSNPQSVTTAALDGSGNNILYSVAFKTANSSTITSGGLPNNGTITSSGNTWQLNSYSSNNALFFAPQNASSSAKLIVSSPAAYSQISLLAAAGYGSTSVSITLKFADNTSASYGTYAILDWFDNTPFVTSSLGRINRNSTVSNNNAPSTDPRLYQTTITLTAADQVKNLAQVIITDNSTNNLSTAAFFALSGIKTSTLALNNVDLSALFESTTNTIDLHWEMIGGPSTSGGVQYEIQRSGDDAAFSTLATMDATNADAYSWSDNTIQTGASYYYRILQTSAAGEARYSNVVHIQTPGSTRSNYTVTQSGDLLYVNTGSTSRTQPLEYAVYNMAGQRYVSGTATAGNVFTVNLHALTHGIYFIHLQGSTGSQAVEFLR